MMRRTYAALATLALLPLLVGCTAATNDTTTATSNEQSADIANSADVTLNDGWAKAGAGMSGLFGTLQNNTDEDLTVIGQSSASANVVELHEVTADGLMQEITGPVIIPAGGTLMLAPGSTHIMLMEMPAELLAGDTVTVTLELSNGATAQLTALVKEYGGANESYGDIAHSDSSDAGLENNSDTSSEHDMSADHSNHDDHDGH